MNHYFDDRLPDDVPEEREWDLETSAERAERELRALLDEIKLDDEGRRILMTYFSPTDEIFDDAMPSEDER